MKKAYTTPKIKVVQLNCQHVLLQSSDGDTTKTIEGFIGMAPTDDQHYV